MAQHPWSATVITYITICCLNLEWCKFHSLSYSLLNIGVVLLLAHVPLSSVRVNVLSFGGAMLNHGGSLLFIQPYFEGFRHGFMLNFDGPECDTLSNNSPTALLKHTEVSKKIQQESDSGRIAGPFDKPPLPNFKWPPLSLGAKKDPGKFRLLHNLSFPYDKSPVNNNIPKLAATVKYASLKDAILNIQQCSPGAWMAKADIANAIDVSHVHKALQYPLYPSCWR